MPVAPGFKLVLIELRMAFHLIDHREDTACLHDPFDMPRQAVTHADLHARCPDGKAAQKRARCPPGGLSAVQASGRETNPNNRSAIFPNWYKMK